VATTPLPMVELFMPSRMQLADPAAVVQAICLPAAVAAGPAAKVGVPKSVVE